jgi:hypothetical protein
MGTFFVFCVAFIAALTALEFIIPRDLRWNRVGGLVHWRIGRLGGSFYLARRAR